MRDFTRLDAGKSLLALAVIAGIALAVSAAPFAAPIADEARLTRIAREAFRDDWDDLALLDAEALAQWEAPEGTFERVEMSHAGLDRVYVIYTPVNLQPNSPLMLLIHFASGSPMMAEMMASMAHTADKFGYVIAYPRGVNRTFYAGPICCGGHEERDDIGLMRHIVADVAVRRGIDTRRVYSGGLSNGGYMSYRLACDASDLVAAVSVVAAGSSWGAMMPHCHPTRPVPMLQMHGTRDPSFDYGLNSFHDMLKINACAAEGTVTLQQGVTTCESFSHCGVPGVNMTFCTAEGVGHMYWPGSFPTNMDFAGSAEMLTFFNHYSL